MQLLGVKETRSHFGSLAELHRFLFGRKVNEINSNNQFKII